MNQRKAGILLSYINFGINGLIMLAYVPMLLHYVSKEQYGVYQMVGSFIAVIGTLDFGMRATVIRFLSREKALNNTAQARKLINTSASLYMLLTGFLLVLGAGGYFLLSPVYGGALSTADLHTAKQIYLILLLNLAVCIPGNLSIAVVQANERFVFFQLWYLVCNILSPLVIWGALIWTANVVSVVWVQTGFNALFMAVLFGYSVRQLGIRVRLGWANRPLVKQLIGFSFFVFLGNIANQLYTRLGPLVLGLFAGTLAVANYYIAAQILMVFVLVPALVSDVFLPKLSGDFAKTDSLQVHNDIFCKTGRLQSLVAFLILTGFVLLGKVFLTLWLGAGNEMCYSLAAVLMTGALTFVIQSSGAPILMAVDKYRFYAWTGLATALINVGMAFPLVKRYGTMGCAVSYVISIGIINSLLMNWYYHRIGLHVRAFVRAVLPVVLGSVGTCGILWGIWQYWPATITWDSFIAHGICIVTVYGVVMAAFVLNRFEWDIVREIFQTLFHRNSF